MAIETKEQKYAGVDVNHPSIVSAIKTMVKQGRNTGDIMRVTGMPQEVVHKYTKVVR